MRISKGKIVEALRASYEKYGGEDFEISLNNLDKEIDVSQRDLYRMMANYAIEGQKFAKNKRKNRKIKLILRFVTILTFIIVALLVTAVFLKDTQIVKWLAPTTSQLKKTPKPTPTPIPIQAQQINQNNNVAPQKQTTSTYQEGYDWAKNMNVTDRAVCDTFMGSHGADFVSGCKAVIGSGNNNTNTVEINYLKQQQVIVDTQNQMIQDSMDIQNRSAEQQAQLQREYEENQRRSQEERLKRLEEQIRDEEQRQAQQADSNRNWCETSCSTVPEGNKSKCLSECRASNPY